MLGGLRGDHQDFFQFILAMIGTVWQPMLCSICLRLEDYNFLANKTWRVSLFFPDFSNTEQLIPLLVIPLASNGGVYGTWSEPGEVDIAQRMLAASL